MRGGDPIYARKRSMNDVAVAVRTGPHSVNIYRIPFGVCINLELTSLGHLVNWGRMGCAICETEGPLVVYDRDFMSRVFEGLNDGNLLLNLLVY